jgi:hypothetical protein
MEGHMLSLFLMQHFIDALKDLSEHDVKDPAVLLTALSEQDAILHNNFFGAPVP